MAYDEVIEVVENVLWLGEFDCLVRFFTGVEFFVDDFVAQTDAFVANVYARTRNELSDLFLRFVAKTTFK